MSHALASNRLAILRDRAEMFAKARKFFADRQVMEVDVPILSRFGSIDQHIDLVTARCLGKECFLHFSPEYAMKRLLVEEIGDIYQLAHVFRDEERGERHLPEFVMAEWYRLGFTLKALIDETIDFILLFFRERFPVEFLSYHTALHRYVEEIPSSEEEIHHVFGLEVEPKLGFNGITVITGFPTSQAFMARTYQDGNQIVAARFEVFFQGMELANGYHELSDPEEQLVRFEEGNRDRIAIGKRPYPIDKPFLEALKQGLPDCCGVAVGFDRLMMLRHQISNIEDVVPFVLDA